MSTMTLCIAEWTIWLRLHRSQASRLGTSVKVAKEHLILRPSDVTDMAGAVMAVINREA